MNDSINNEGSETSPMTPQDAPTEPQAQVAPEPAPVEPAPVAPAVQPAHEPVGYTPGAYAPQPNAPASVPAPEPKRGVTISHRALWIGGAVLLALALFAGSFGFGVSVGRHTGDRLGRFEGGMMLQAPNADTYGWQHPDPRGYGDGSGEYGREYGQQNGGQGWHGRGYRNMPPSQLPTGTPAP